MNVWSSDALLIGDLVLVHDGPPQSAHRSKPPHVGIVVGMSTPPRTTPRTPLHVYEVLVQTQDGLIRAARHRVEQVRD